MITLTMTWNPRGELPRYRRIMPTLREVYQQQVVVLPPDVEAWLVDELSALGITTIISKEWSWGRYLALHAALETSAARIHYADLDRLVRWVETREAEWRRSVDMLALADCVCFGRTPLAYATHPRALIDTEATSNRVISHLLGRRMDVSAGSKGFSRKAAAFLDAHTQPGAAMGMDAAWMVLLNRAGYQIKYVEVDGLDWESADAYRMEAADAEIQRQAAAAYDADVSNWAWRVEVADEVVKTGLGAACQPLEPKWLNSKAHFEVEDYLYFYLPNLTEARTEAEVDGIVQLLGLDEPVDILDLACGYGRHTNRLSARGQRMWGVDNEAGFLEIARKQADEMGLAVHYELADMRSLSYKQEFDIVLLLFTSFGYFEDDENLAVLNNIQKALRPGGRLLVDMPNRVPFVEHLPPAFVDEVGQDIMINRGSYDEQTRRWYNRRVVIRNGVRKDKPFFVRLYDEREIQTLLREAGMDDVQIYSGWHGEAMTPDARRMIILARKPDNTVDMEQK